ncbi:MAG: S-layer homology domain-containing protein [Oscillospiraceae bacterium]
MFNTTIFAQSTNKQTDKKQTEIDATVSMDRDTEIISVHGKIPISKGNVFVSIQIKNEKSQFSTQTVTNSDGTFSIKAKINGDSGKYEMICNWEFGSKPLSIMFDYYNDKTIENSLLDINCADASLIKNALNNNKEILGLYELNDKLLLPYIDEIASLVLKERNTGYKKVSDLQKTVKYAAFFCSLKHGLPQTEVLELLIELKDDFSTLCGYEEYISIKNPIELNKIIASQNIEPLAEILNVFNEKTALYQIKNIDSYLNIKTLLNRMKDIYKLDLDKYNSLENTTAIDKALAGKEFGSVSELRTMFEDKLNPPPTPGNNSGSGGSSGGGSGGGGNLSFDPIPTPIPTPIDKEIFMDINSALWAKDSIIYLYENGIINGRDDKMFEPNETITREEFVKLLIVAFNLDDATAVCDFKDLTKDNWAYRYIASAYKHGITLGIDENNFGIGLEITREEMAVLCMRTAKIANIEISSGDAGEQFVDANEISDYAIDSINAMRESNIINGVGDNRFAPKENATRAEAAKIIYNFLEKNGGIIQ